MDNRSFVADNFDSLKTLQRKERSLLGDMRVAFMDRNLSDFQKLLHRTGYRNAFQVENVQITNTHLSRLGLRKFKTTRNLLFERDDMNESLFEDILRKQGPGVSKFINLIWTECELWRKKDVIQQTNSMGKQWIDYVIESNDDENLFSFLVFDFEVEAESVKKSSKNYFLKIKNDQYLERTGETLFQKFYATIDGECEEIIYNLMEKLLREMQQIIDIKGECSIDVVLKMENEIFKNKILKLLLTYWKIYSKEYHHYKLVLSNLSPFYRLFLILKEKHEFEFEELFPQYIEAMRAKHGEEKYEAIVRNDCNSLLELALFNGQRRAINIIINCTLIDPNKVFIKLNDSSFDSQNAHYIMSKLLEKGLYLGNDDNTHVPIDWISAQVFEDFLDTRVKEDGIHGCQINYDFLVDPKIRNEEMKDGQYDSGKLLFSDGTKALENILNNERLKSFITHPVLSTFINLKTRKFRLIFNLNFYIFLFLYIVPFFLLVTLIPFGKFYSDTFEKYGTLTMTKKRKIYKILGITLAQFLTFPWYACILATAYLTLREALQLFVIADSLKSYFKKRSNQFEIIIIVLSWFVLYGMKFLKLSDIKDYMTIPSAFVIIFATVELLSILPYPSMSIYMFMLKQVTNTFLKFFTIFILVIIAFTFSFCVVLKPPSIKAPSPWRQLRKDWNNYTATTNNTVFAEFKEPAVLFVNTLEDALEDNGTIFRNFENPFTSFQKTLMMLSGEYTIDPYTLDSVSKQILFLFFVFTSFILFNLINGLAISDIAQLKDHAEFLNLKQQIRNTSESEGVVCDIYWRLCDKSNKSWWRQLVMYAISLLVRRYPYLHKMDNLCIDFKRKCVKYESNEKRYHILMRRNNYNEKYVLEEDSLKKLNAIVEKKQTEVESVNDKVNSLQAEVKNLKLSMRHQHEEIKKLLQEFLHDKM